MAFIQTIPVNQAADEVRALYQGNQQSLGYVPNYAKIFSHRPDVMAAWGALIGAVRGHLELRRYELVTLAAARALRSSYCMLAHGTILRQKFYDARALTAIAAGDDGPLTAQERAIIAYAGKLAHDASTVTAADIDDLRAHGLTDPEIFDIAAAAAARCFFSKLLDALGAEPDSAYQALEDELRRQLTVGRPISRVAVETVPGG